MRDHKTLLCWQLARDFTLQIHQLTVTKWTPPASAAFEQLRRAAISIRLNIAEGYALGSPGYFARHLNIAYGSAVEAAEVLEFCQEAALLGAEEAGALIGVATRIQALVLRLRQRYSNPRTACRPRDPRRS